MTFQVAVADILEEVNRREGELLKKIHRIRDAYEVLLDENTSLRRLLSVVSPKHKIPSEISSHIERTSTMVEKNTIISDVNSEDTFNTSPSFFGEFEFGKPAASVTESEEEDDEFSEFKCHGIKKSGVNHAHIQIGRGIGPRVISNAGDIRDDVLDECDCVDFKEKKKKPFCLSAKQFRHPRQPGSPLAPGT